MKPHQVRIFSSSHGTPRHHLPDAFRSMQETKPSFEQPIFYAKGGLKINAQVEQDIFNKLQLDFGKTKQIFVILLGDNNLRAGESPDQVVSHLRSILEMPWSMNDIQMIICGMLPCPRTHWWSKGIFGKTNKLIQELKTKEGFKFTYVDLNGVFLKNGKPRYWLFKDGLHLKPGGALLLAHHLVKFFQI